jgi:hypothetical protein
MKRKNLVFTFDPGTAFIVDCRLATPQSSLSGKRRKPTGSVIVCREASVVSCTATRSGRYLNTLAHSSCQ